MTSAPCGLAVFLMMLVILGVLSRLWLWPCAPKSESPDAVWKSSVKSSGKWPYY